MSLMVNRLLKALKKSLKRVDRNKYMHIVLQLITIFYIVIFAYYPAHAQEAERIFLSDWELTVGSTVIPSKAVLWDTPVTSGGMGRSYNGYGTYRNRFIIPEKMSTTQLAFFVSSIDDADETFFNGVIIGKTGLFPESSPAGFQSGVRKPRLYVIPQHLIKYNEKNEIVIKVFNYAGAGGLNGRNDPVIAPYETLTAASLKQIQQNDIIRAFYLAVQLCMLILLTYTLTRLGNRKSFTYALHRAARAFNIIRCFDSMDAVRSSDFIGEILFRIIMAMITTISFFLFIFSELTFKYIFITSEIFWFKAPAISLYIGFLSLITIYHTEIFELKLSLKKPFNPARIFFAVSTHPSILSLFLVYLILAPVAQSWSAFTITGSIIMFSVLSIMFLYTIYRFIRVSLKTQDSLYSKFLRREGLLRGIFVMGFLWGFIIFHKTSPLINAQASLVVTLFSFLYMSMSLIFFMRYNISIPSEHQMIPVAEKLKNDYSLTPAEAHIAEQICRGMSREHICGENVITPATLKIHLKSIYSKTIEPDPFEKNSKSGKLQRLTVFLHNLEK